MGNEMNVPEKGEIRRHDRDRAKPGEETGLLDEDTVEKVAFAVHAAGGPRDELETVVVLTTERRRSVECGAHSLPVS